MEPRRSSSGAWEANVSRALSDAKCRLEGMRSPASCSIGSPHAANWPAPPPSHHYPAGLGGYVESAGTPLNGFDYEALGYPYGRTQRLVDASRFGYFRSANNSSSNSVSGC